MAPLILNHDTVWRWVDTFICWLLYAKAWIAVATDRNAGKALELVWTFREQKSPAPARVKTTDHSANRPVISTDLMNWDFLSDFYFAWPLEQSNRQTCFNPNRQKCFDLWPWSYKLCTCNSLHHSHQIWWQSEATGRWHPTRCPAMHWPPLQYTGKQQMWQSLKHIHNKPFNS